MTKIYAVIGYPVEHSLSPVMQNAAFKYANIDAEYKAIEVMPEDLGAFMQFSYNENICGLNVTMPHKEAIGQYVQADEIAQKIGAINTVYKEKDKFFGTNTDWRGIVDPLKAATKLKDKKVTILGAGGAAKAACYGLFKTGADVTIWNRTHEKAEELAKRWGFKASEEVGDSEIIINCTSVGFEDAEESPVSSKVFKYTEIAFDVVYGVETKFTRDAKAAGAIVIDGLEMLLHQGYACFEIWTGQPAPKDMMRSAVKEQLTVNN